jgi:hypothetical protein
MREECISPIVLGVISTLGAMMSSATRRAARLADHLCRETGVGVEVDWLCVRGEDCFVVTWRDGPDEVSVREMAARYAAVAPTQVHCARELTPLASASALLLWLLGHPDQMESLSTLTVIAAHSQVAYPDRAPEAVVELARAVLAVSPDDRLDDETLTLLAPRARQGWTAFSGWLQSTVRRPDNVVDLAAERRRRAAR